MGLFFLVWVRLFDDVYLDRFGGWKIFGIDDGGFGRNNLGHFSGSGLGNGFIRPFLNLKDLSPFGVRHI